LRFLNLLFRNGDKEFYYWRDKAGKEVDFVVKEGLKVKELIQACWGIGEEKTERREVRALIKAMGEFKLNPGLAITEDIDKEVEVDGKRIVYKPLREWLKNRYSGSFPKSSLCTFTISFISLNVIPASSGYSKSR